MDKKKPYLICILQHRNVNYSITAFLHLHNALRHCEKLRNQCKIVFACTTHFSKTLYALKKQFQDIYDLDIFECEGYYPKKLQAIFDNYRIQDYQYFVKHDEDIFLSSQSWVRLLKNSPEELAQDKSLLTTVNLSMGIPSWSCFAECLLNDGEQRNIYDRLSHDSIPANIWGNDYSSLNDYIQSQLDWNETGYWEKINSLGYHYRGLHPIRTNLWYASYINQATIKRYTDFQNTTVNDQFKKTNNRYFCNSFFVINYDLYQKILQDRSLYLDNFDEIPINRYCNDRDLNICFLKNSLGIHIIYNTVFDQKIVLNGKTMRGKEVEEYFLERYLLSAIEHLRNLGCDKINALKLYNKPLSEKLKDVVKQFALYRFLKRFRS